MLITSKRACVLLIVDVSGSMEPYYEGICTAAHTLHSLCELSLAVADHNGLSFVDALGPRQYTAGGLDMARTISAVGTMARVPDITIMATDNEYPAMHSVRPKNTHFVWWNVNAKIRNPIRWGVNMTTYQVQRALDHLKGQQAVRLLCGEQ